MSVEKYHLLNAPLSISLAPNEGRKGRLDIAQNDYDLHKACSPHSGSLQISHLYNFKCCGAIGYVLMSRSEILRDICSGLGNTQHI